MDHLQGESKFQYIKTDYQETLLSISATRWNHGYKGSSIFDKSYQREVLIEADSKIAASEILQNKDCAYWEIDPFVADIKAFIHVNPRISFHCISRTA